MKKLFISLILLSMGSVTATGHVKRCTDFSKSINNVVGTKFTGEHGIKHGLTKKEFDQCVKTGSVTVRVA